MIKGAALLAVGFGLGYVKAMSDQEAIQEAARIFVQFLQDIALEEEIQRKKAADAKAGAVDATAEEVSEDEASEEDDEPSEPEDEASEQDDEPPTAA